MNNVFVFDHPLIQHKLTLIRDKQTGTKEFRELVDEVTTLMTYEITRNMPTKDVLVETPITQTTGKVLSGKKIGVVPILRAGLGMVDGILTCLPAAKVGHIGLYRDEKTITPVQYYSKLPSDLAERWLILVDPMLATGGSANQAIQLLKEQGAKDIHMMCLIAAPEGLQHIIDFHPDVLIYTAAIDERLNQQSFIYPGLGDAGDRMFGTD